MQVDVGMVLHVRDQLLRSLPAIVAVPVVAPDSEAVTIAAGLALLLALACRAGGFEQILAAEGVVVLEDLPTSYYPLGSTGLSINWF